MKAFHFAFSSDTTEVEEESTMLCFSKEVLVLVLLASDGATLQPTKRASKSTTTPLNMLDTISGTNRQETITVFDNEPGFRHVTDDVRITENRTDGGSVDMCSYRNVSAGLFKDVYDRFSLPGASVDFFLCFISILTNSLCLYIHSRKKLVLATYFIALSATDIMLGIATGIIQVPFFVKPSGQSVNTRTVAMILQFSMGRSFCLALQRANQALSALICVDRFILLSHPLSTDSVIKRHSKKIVCIVLALLFTCSILEAYYIYIDRMTKFQSVTTVCNFTISTVNSNTIQPTMPIPTQPSTTETAELTVHRGITVADVQVDGDGDARRGPSISELVQVFQYLSLVNNIVMYLLLACMIIINTATIMFLKRQSGMRQKLGTEGRGHKESLILVTITTVYVTLAIPATAVSLVRDLKIWPEFDLHGELRYLFMILAKCSSMCEAMKNISDFLIFMLMSRVFRQTLVSALWPKKLQSSKSISSKATSIKISTGSHS